MKVQRRARIASLCAIASIASVADAGETIAVQVEFGPAYAEAIGAARSADAKAAAETSLVGTLGERIKYFDFVPSANEAQHRLVFRIDHPLAASIAETGPASLDDYYVFLSLNGDDDAQVKWLFRDAASSLNGAESAQSIAGSLSEQLVLNRRLVIEELLRRVSFTDQATFKPAGVQGWVIQRSRSALCIKENSQIKVHTTLPGEEIEEDFEAEVKRSPSADHVSMFTRVKSGQDVALLVAAPDQARVLGVYVLKYEQECAAELPVTESSPASTTF